MKTAPPGWLSSVSADPEALIKEARRRQHRRYLAVGLAVVVMLAGAVGVTVSVTGPGGHAPSHQGTRRVPTPRGKSPSSSAVFARSAMPRFFADAVTTGEGNESLQVRASANGRLLAQEEHMTGVYGLAATGADSFVIALQAGAGCAARLYRVQLNGQGHPGGLSPVGPELHGLVWSLAASAGGGIIGYAVSGCAKGDPGYIGIFNTRTGRSGQWNDVNLGGVSPGNVAMQGALSMSASGGSLAFTGWDVAGDGRYTSQVVRVLSTTAPAGTVAERSHVVLSRPVSQPELTAASLSPGGTFFYLATQTGSRTGRVTDVARYRTSTGEFLGNLASLRGTPTQMRSPMALDVSGRFLLVPYSLDPGDLPTLKVAGIDVTTRAVVALTIQLPGTAGMDPETGMNTAW
jgi:hypothetical protein